MNNTQSPPAMPGSPQAVCTHAQRVVIGNQVEAARLFKLALKRNIPIPLPQEWLPHLSPPPLDAPNPTIVSLQGQGQAVVARLQAKRMEQQRQMQQQQHQHQHHHQHHVVAAASPQHTQHAQFQPGQPPLQQSIVNDLPHIPLALAPSPASVPEARPLTPPPPAAAATPHQQLRDVALPLRPAPLYVAVDGNSDPITNSLMLPGHLPSCEVSNALASLIRAEYDRMLQDTVHRRIPLLESVLADPNAAPGMRWRGERPSYGTALLQLRALRALARQRELRAALDANGKDILEMPEKVYKQMRKQHAAARTEAARREEDAERELAATWAREAKAYRSDVMGAACGAVKDLRVARNRGILRAHERLSRERLRAAQKDDQAARMAALKAHDFEAYQEMLRRQAGGTPAAGERYEAISKFLADTEAYLHRLAGKIAAVKASAEASTAAARAIADARAQGLSEEEAQAAARAAAAEAASGSQAMRDAVEGAGDAQSRYYALAHSNQEEITDQPTLLRPPNNARLREYQIVGLQWMVSLYNNHLNGILADEMGLGKTVQVMSLIAYLMEKKQNFGPHLIIVPNAVIVNWKSELTQWLPSARCVYYVGGKEDRGRKYTTEVQPLQFNVLVTTYEFIMRDRAKLSKIDWQYIVIDEAQRMKDRQSKLAKDLDKFRAARRLLLSGTPLQNDLQELWSLLNLLLPDVFDDKKVFAEWFGEAIASSGGPGGDDWLQKEKRVVVIHRLHQILEPFMLRRQVEDVETKLPPKVAHTVRVPMSAHQSSVYTWVKATGTLRLDPEAPTVGKIRRRWASLQNKCMELRKVCNHPLLSYPPMHWGVGPAIVRQCGKMVVLDRMLVKLRAAGHRVLLFSTMTKLLDLLEVYLQWRRLPESFGGGLMRYLRIDGSTSLEDRETAIQRFNAPQSETFIFLLSIRAAGRGLNLQSSDTVIIYDPDPNPKNEEQAIARSHRIGQSKEVRVYHLEAVTDTAAVAPPPPAAVVAAPVTDDDAHQAVGNGVASPPPAAAMTEDEDFDVMPEGPAGASSGKRLFGDSIESIVRGQIQKIKIEMANEVIDAGRFDQRTSMEERRATLESLLHDQDRSRSAKNSVPSWKELNAMLARGEEELKLFESLDEDKALWFDLTHPREVPPWMQWGEQDLRSAMEENTKHHRVDMEAEMAALMGTVLHHHHPPAPEKVATPAPAKVAAEPAITTTTTRTEGGEEEEDEVDMVDNDEEEEVLDENLELNGDEATTDGVRGGGPTLVGVPRVESTAGSGMLQGSVALGEKRGSHDEMIIGAEPGEDHGGTHKRQRTLSVHFEEPDVSDGY